MVLTAANQKNLTRHNIQATEKMNSIHLNKKLKCDIRKEILTLE
jgi:hypothetical protein